MATIVPPFGAGALRRLQIPFAIVMVGLTTLTLSPLNQTIIGTPPA